MEVVGADNDLGLSVRHPLHLVAPLTHGLDRALHGLGTAVHWQHLVGADKLSDLNAKGAGFVEGARAVACLLIQ